MLTLLKNGEVFAPEPLGRKDLLLCSHTIAAIADPGTIQISGTDVDQIEAGNSIILPGFIDSHVHILGGGGEGGPATRAPEITLEDIINSGVTTVIGCLGTDGTTRHMASLLAKSRGLEAEGVNTYIFSGSYEIPVVTITGSVRSDLVLIEKVVGAGEIAVSDHRSAQPTFEDFAKLAAECRVGGMLGGKAGILHCHMGSGPRKMELIHRLIAETEIPSSQVIPTHVNRNRDLLEEAAAFMRSGGFVDLTAGLDPGSDKDEVSIASSVDFFRSRGASLDQVSVSSDSNGSMPRFDSSGNLIGLTIATQESLLLNFRHLVSRKILSLAEASALFSTNPSVFYKFSRKGRVKAGMDADIIVLDQNLNLTHHFIQGKKMMDNRNLVVHGTFSS